MRRCLHESMGGTHLEQKLGLDTLDLVFHAALQLGLLLLRCLLRLAKLVGLRDIVRRGLHAVSEDARYA